MRWILTTIIIAITGFFLLVFVQEYETLLKPFFVKNESPSQDLVNQALKVVQRFNEILQKGYQSGNPDILLDLPATEEIRAEFKMDLEGLKREKRAIRATLKEFNLIDSFILDDNITVIADELWEYQEQKSSMSETQKQRITYTINRNSLLITRFMCRSDEANL